MEIHPFSGILTLANVKFLAVRTYDAIVDVVSVTCDVFVWLYYHAIFQLNASSCENIVVSIFAKSTLFSATHLDFLSFCRCISICASKELL